jgi:hypothetical protein
MFNYFVLLLILLLLLFISNVTSMKCNNNFICNSNKLNKYILINGGKKKDLSIFTMIRAFWLTLINPEVSIY